MNGRVPSEPGSRASTEPVASPVSAASGFDPSRNCRRCPDGDRPAQEPGGMECGRCGCIFIGEEWHGFCAVCIAAIAREIAASQGQFIMNEPEYSDSDRHPEGDETAQTGSVGEADRARGEAIAQDQSSTDTQRRLG